MLRNIIKYVKIPKRYCHHNTPKEPPLQCCCKMAEQLNNKLHKIDNNVNKHLTDIKYNLDMSFFFHITSWVSIIATFFS
jgi:hypothetical protein